MSHTDLGNTAEDLVGQWLTQRGHHVLYAKYRTRRGELDLVTLRAGTLVVVEVKACTRGAKRAPAATVTMTKRARIVATTEFLLVRERLRVRRIEFSVAEVWLPDGEIRYTPDAFRADEVWRRR